MATAYPAWLEALLPVKLGYEESPDYVVAEKYYGYSKNVTSYLIAMNDGMHVAKQEGFKGLLTYNHPDYMSPRNKIVRSTRVRRDQKFIARFLEILWTSTDTVDNVVST